MFKVECYKVYESLKFCRMPLNGGPCDFDFFRGGLREKRAQFFLGDVTSIETMVW